MDPVVSFTPQQFDELIAAVRGGQLPANGLEAAAHGAGLGASPRVAGLGCGDGGMGPLAVGVYQMLAAGSPRLALAKAKGIPLAPYFINIRATFADTSVSTVPDVASDVKIMQDTLIDGMLYTITNLSPNANQNQFQAQSDYYYKWQSGIEATLDVTGAPRYAVAPNFMPLATMADAFNGDARVGSGWILTYNEQLKMSFNAKVTLPTAPMEVVVTFRTLVPVWDDLVQMTNKEAFRLLRDDCGIVLDPAYADRCCR